MQIQSSWRENLIKANQILTSCHRSTSKNPEDLLAGLLFFFFSSNSGSAVLKLCKSWYETRFSADQAVIAAILNSLDMLLLSLISGGDIERFTNKLYSITLTQTRKEKSSIISGNFQTKKQNLDLNWEHIN